MSKFKIGDVVLFFDDIWEKPEYATITDMEMHHEDWYYGVNVRKKGSLYGEGYFKLTEAYKNDVGEQLMRQVNLE